METSQTTAPSRSSNELAGERTDLAFTRTVLALERTLMAWVRTAVSLISFGFTIYKFFQEFQRTSQSPHLASPRAVGLVMIGLGVGFEDLPRDANLRAAVVVARLFGSSARIARNAARLHCLIRVAWRVPVGSPLPYIADHVDETVAVRWEAANR